MPATKRRRWLSLSLRTLLIGMTLISVLFGWFLHYRREKVAERERLEEEFAHSDVQLAYCDSLLGYTLPFEDINDPWWLLRPLALPELESAKVFWDPAHPASERMMSVAQRASEIRLSSNDDFPLERVVSRNTRRLAIEGDISAEELSAIAQAPFLRELNCYGGVLTKPALHCVLTHPSVQSVSFETDAESLAALPRQVDSPLRSLHIEFASHQGSASKSEQSYRWLSGCKVLESIRLYDPDASFLRQVGEQLGGVEKLDLLGVDQATVNCLSKWSRLRDISLRACLFEDDVLARIAEFSPNLESLDIDGVGGAFSPVGLKSLERLPRLKRLALESCSLTREHVIALGALTKLEELSLYSNALDDRTLAPLAALRHLRKLDLERTDASPSLFVGIRGSWKNRPGGFQ